MFHFSQKLKIAEAQKRLILMRLMGLFFSRLGSFYFLILGGVRGDGAQDGVLTEDPNQT